MAASPFGINVVSRSHRVVCHTCHAASHRVAETCPNCGTALEEGGFGIVRAASTIPSRALRRLRTLRRAPAA